MFDQSYKAGKPSVVTNPLYVRWGNVLVGVLIGAVLIGAGLVGYYYFQLKKVSPRPSSATTTTATTSATPATPTTQKDETTNWKVYTNSNLGFSIKYPNNWFYNDASKYATENCAPGPGIDENTVLFDRKSLNCQGVAHFALWPAEFVVYVSLTEWTPLENIPGEKFTSINIDGEKAAKNFKSATSEGPRCDCTRIYMNHKSRGYYIEFADKDLLGNYDPIYDKIISTFKFL